MNRTTGKNENQIRMAQNGIKSFQLLKHSNLHTYKIILRILSIVSLESWIHGYENRWKIKSLSLWAVVLAASPHHNDIFYKNIILIEFFVRLGYV